jgi:hypothetical protein
MERLTLREALASDRLEAFVRQEESSGVELVTGSDLERALALLITIRWSGKTMANDSHVVHRFEQV